MRSRTTLVTTLGGAAALAALAACADQPTAVRPQPTTPSRSVAAAAPNGTYLVLDRGSGFKSDFTSRVAALGGSVVRVHGGAGFAVVSGLTDAAAAQLAVSNDVSDVEADAQITLDAPVAAAEADASSVTDPTIASQMNPTLASRYSWQWNMRDIHADKAWAAGKLGSPSVTVAIIDTGIDYDALDLAGLVDLSRSASFVASDDSITAKYFASRNPISDYNGHGTNVATQVSSKAVALAGVTSKTTLIGVKVLDASGHGSLGSVLSGVLWAADHGADVANMSLGGGFSKAGNGRLVSLINRVFNYANKQGMLIVVAAGNDEADLDHNGNELTTYCNQQHVICVSAVGPTSWEHSTTAFATSPSNSDVPAFFTNFGRSAITVAGPGGNALVNPDGSIALQAWPWGNDIASWVWSFCSKTRIAGFTSTGTPVLTACSAGNRISGFIGTSQATPHVAGLAALLAAETGRGKPSQLKSLITKSAVDLGQAGVDPFYGAGRIDVAKALGL